MVQELPVLTPEKAILTYRLAGLGNRVGAHVIDLGLCGAGLFVIAILLSLTVARMDGQVSAMITAVLFSLGPFAYFILFEGLWNGQTPGKKATGIRVRMLDGTPVTFMAAVGRNLLRPADMLPGVYLVGIVAMFLNAKSQRIGDLASGTIVVLENRPNVGFMSAPHQVGIHRFEGDIGELRGMTIEEYQALRRFCDRFPTLSDDTQRKLIKDLWQPIARRRGVPEVPDVHPVYLAEAAVMKYGRQHGLL